MMDEFKTLLQKFAKNECGIDEVTTNLQQLLQKHPQLASPIQDRIEKFARNKHISQSAADAIGRVTARFIHSESDDQTVISSDNDNTEISAHTRSLIENEPGTHDATAPEDDVADLSSPMATSITDSGALKADVTFLDPTTTLATPLPNRKAADASPATDTGLTIADTKTDADGMPVMEHGEAVIGVGSVLRNRFELTAKLGEGGMGAVFMATDKIKEEAQDKNPHVAVKVLNEAFKQFRESFIALQRESSKQQRLAHPNIATVFDFDRDYTLGTVFMTMEMLEGEPLDKYIRRLPPSGLTYEDAKPLIDGMCNGLAYAHHHDLVHSDFKPANTFLNKEGVIKLLDFGIARAAKPKIGADGQKEATLFDPGTLGALTPAYASPEMLEGDTPEPSDDIYALAAVTYQLLGGKHPFNKMPANQARDNKLVPTPIKQLNRRQSKAMAKGLAFARANRTQTVEEFLDGITPKKPILAYAVTTAFIMLTIIGVLARGVIEDHFRNIRNNEISTLITDASANRRATEAAKLLEELRTFDEESQDLIKADPGVQKAIIGYFIRRMDQLIDKAAGRHNYPKAASIMAEARSFYPDSGTLDTKQENLDAQKVSELENQRDLYTRFLKIGPWLTTEGDENDIPDVIAILREVDPQAPLLTDPRLIGSYINEARVARQEANFQRADALIAQAGEFADDNTAITLTNEADALERAKHLSANQDTLTKLLTEVTAINANEGLSQALSVSEELSRIRLLSPENEFLTSTANTLSQIIPKTIQSSNDRALLSQATNQYQTLAAALTAEQRQPIREALNAAWQKIGGMDPAIAQQTQQRADVLKSRITEASDKADFTHMGTQSLQSLLQELEALDLDQQADIRQLRLELATHFIREATEVSESGLMVRGNALIEYAKYFDAEAPGLAAAEKALADALEQQEIKRIEVERLATITALKQDTLSKARSEKIDDALRFLDLLKVYLLPDDVFLTTEGPEAIANAYASIALRAKSRADSIQKDYIGQREGYIAALEQVKTGLGIAPGLKSLTNARAGIQNALAIAEVRNTFSTSDTLDLADLNTKLDRIMKFDASVFTQLQTEFSETVARRISTMESYDPKSAKLFLDAAKQLPINRVLLSRIKITVPNPSKFSQKIIEAIKVSNLTAANSILKKALSEESDHPEIKRLRGVLADKVNTANNVYKKYLATLRSNNTDQSKVLIATALKIWRDNTEFQSAFKSINISIIASKAVCQNRLAGYGRRSRGHCYDMVSSTTQGPVLVVLPAGAGHDTPFAMSKFEISIHDFNQYCQQTKQCATISKAAKLPVTGISISQAKQYAAWLSKISGAQYRLPTDEEWTYAASAGGKQPKGKSYNCTLRLGDKIMKGTGLEDVNSGKQNGWGLTNYIGNAQEWVETPAGLKARGGAYKDAMLNCTIELERAHDGKPDEITTFRIVRNIT